MFGLKTAGVLGASVVMAGGVAYLVWNYASSPEEKETETRPEEDGKKAEDEGEIQEETMVEHTVVAAAVAPVVASEAPKAPEVKTLPWTHLPLETVGGSVVYFTSKYNLALKIDIQIFLQGYRQGETVRFSSPKTTLVSGLKRERKYSK